jgi:hypothetical protein
MAELNIVTATEWSKPEAGTRVYRVILWKRDDAHAPYVVHYQAQEARDRWQGTYCSTLSKAATEFEKRASRHGLATV